MVFVYYLLISLYANATTDLVRSLNFGVNAYTILATVVVYYWCGCSTKLTTTQCARSLCRSVGPITDFVFYGVAGTPRILAPYLVSLV